MVRRLRFAAVLAAAAAAEELLVPLPTGGQVGFSTCGLSAFRVRLIFDHRDPIETPMVSPGQFSTQYNKTRDSRGYGITAAIGSVFLSYRETLVLYDQEGHVLTESEPLAIHPSALALSSDGGKLYGSGATLEDCGRLTATLVQPLICNRATKVPYYYSTDGYGALGVVDVARARPSIAYPVTYASDGRRVLWSFSSDFDLYLMPAATLIEGTQALFALTGAPPVPPRYAFGFMASRWGWKDRRDIEDNIARFRAEEYPIDAIIVDFEFFTRENDYLYNFTGKSNFTDFGYNPLTFPSPREQFARYRRDLHVRVGAIRKPRLGNTNLLALARSKKWLLPGGAPGSTYPPNFTASYAMGRNLDFSIPAVRQWYSQQQAQYVDDGVEFWWNDEGETDYFTYHWWNVAHRETQSRWNGTKRFYSLNRAFTPGMARLGATLWTGDTKPIWKDLHDTPGMMLNWGLAGAPYVACDIGGFWGRTKASLLTRWMQLGVFLPTMRVHSVVFDTPHFPWNFGDAPAAAMKQAMQLRYRLLPYHYSLAHEIYRDGVLWMRPLAMEFPGDALAADVVTQWMDGSILVAPVVRNDSRRHIYFPPGKWYALRASNITQVALGGRSVFEGPLEVEGEVAADGLPAFVRAGTVLPLAPVVQFTDALPGGPLEVQVYAGANGSFSLVEDDGETYAYQSGEVRVTSFAWDDARGTLSWAAEGSAPGSFTELSVTLVGADSVSRSPVVALSGSGSIRAALPGGGAAAGGGWGMLWALLAVLACAAVGCIAFYGSRGSADGSDSDTGSESGN